MMTDENLNAEETALNRLAEDVASFAAIQAAQRGLDPFTAAAACGFAGSKILFRMARGDSELFLECVRIMNESAANAAGDMVAGANASNQTRQ